MSLFPRLLLAAVAGLFGVVMLVMAPTAENGKIGFYGFGAFCVAIALACVLRGRAVEFVGSVVASVILALGAWYLGTTLMEGAFFLGRRSESSAFNALMFLAVFGVPSALYLKRARFGFGRREKAAEPESSNEL